MESFEISSLFTLSTPSEQAMILTLHSCANLNVYDSSKHHLGYNSTTGSLDVEIPNSDFFIDTDGTQYALLFTNGTYQVDLVGTSSGEYHLNIVGALNGNVVLDNCLNGAIFAQEKQEFSAVISETSVTFYMCAHIDINPATLNLESKGNWITAYIELSEGFDMQNVDISSIMLNGTISVALSAPIAIGDYDNDGISDLMVKFDRQAVANLILKNCQFIGTTGTMALTITGKLKDGTLFQGRATIRVIMPKLKGSGRFATPV
jgi:hypothetical protein